MGYRLLIAALVCHNNLISLLHTEINFITFFSGLTALVLKNDQYLFDQKLRGQNAVNYSMTRLFEFLGILQTLRYT